MPHSVGVDRPVQDSPPTIGHPAWCDPSVCEPNPVAAEYTVHRSTPWRVAVQHGVIEVALMQVEHGRACAPEVSIRERLSDRTTDPDPRIVVTLYAARLLHRSLGELLTEYERITRPGTPAGEVSDADRLQAIKDAFGKLWDSSRNLLGDYVHVDPDALWHLMSTIHDRIPGVPDENEEHDDDPVDNPVVEAVAGPSLPATPGVDVTP